MGTPAFAMVLGAGCNVTGRTAPDWHSAGLGHLKPANQSWRGDETYLRLKDGDRWGGQAGSAIEHRQIVTSSKAASIVSTANDGTPTQKTVVSVACDSSLG